MLMFRCIFLTIISVLTTVACDTPRDPAENVPEATACNHNEPVEGDPPGDDVIQATDPWFVEAQTRLERAAKQKPIVGPAKNVIMFLGDGMGVSTVTAARIYAGQESGGCGEENYLSFEQFPYLALAKTYNVDAQTPDSAGTASAIMTGVKTRAGVISVSQSVERETCAEVQGNEGVTLLELAEQAGLATGIVTTTKVTHATPATAYAHVSARWWERDTDLSDEAKDQGCKDIAAQLIDFPYGDGIEMVLGGGRTNFLTDERRDPEADEGNSEEDDEFASMGGREDGRDLTSEWMERFDNAAYVWNKEQMDALDLEQVDHVLGLFETGHMEYELDREDDFGGEPSLSEMTATAIEKLSANPNGYFLWVEGGRIDHGHHGNNAARALADAAEFAKAVQIANEHTDASDTLIIVTADHDHAFALTGYARRGNPILGKVISIQGGEHAVDAFGYPYTTISYANGPSAKDGARANLWDVDTTEKDYLQQALVKTESETHSGADVPVYSRGPSAHLLTGVFDQNYIFHVADHALGLRERVFAADRDTMDESGEFKIEVSGNESND